MNAWCKVKRSKSDISRFKIISNLQKKIATLATKAELQVEQDKIGKLQTYDSSLFIDQSAKVSLAMMIRKSSEYFNQFAKISKCQLVSQ